ncbi:GGDEF domain-containing protein [Bacillus sp. AFS040349]|uniref:GGDEF domain-containing protein n=1 Tax=Bacillus sp. AFS040349 TaxID=2033502 RepID=UPI00159BAD2C|nr:diguanylate cyclase [Bacillus sp. AFS040349]
MFAEQLYFFPLLFNMIILLLMSLMAAILYIRTKKKTYVKVGISFFLAMISFIFVSFGSINYGISMFSPAIPLLISSLILVQGGVYYFYNQKNSKKLLYFIITIILVVFTGSTSFQLFSIFPFLILITFSILSYIQISKDMLKRNHYTFSVIFTGLTGISGLLSIVFGMEMILFLFSSFLTISFISQFLMFFERIIDLMQAASYTSVTDGLTGLFNRRFYTKQAELKAQAGYIGVIFCDIDNFKKLNDTQGHDMGDKILKQVANIAKELVKGIGIAGRYGGEEIVLLIENPKVDISEIAEKIRSRVEKETIVTLSVGFATSNGGLNYTEIINLADKYMYESKLSGKNKISGQL